MAGASGAAIFRADMGRADDVRRLVDDVRGAFGAIHVLGIYVASALFVSAFMRFGGGYGWVKSILVGAGTGAVFFWLFEVQFLVPLPKGPLEALIGY